MVQPARISCLFPSRLATDHITRRCQVQGDIHQCCEQAPLPLQLACRRGSCKPLSGILFNSHPRMNNMRLLVFVLLTWVVVLAGNRHKNKKSRNKCPVDAKTCTECISANLNCAWCTHESANTSVSLTDRKNRCMIKSHMVKSKLCAEEDIVYPPRISLKIKKKKPVRRKRPISPQKVALTLRRGVTKTMPIKVFTANMTEISVKFKYPRAVKITLGASCKEFQWKNKLATCSGLSQRKVKFNVTITMRRCLPRPKKIKITVDGNKKKTLKVHLTSRCSCDCEKTPVKGSSLCSRNGNLTCGVCACNPGFYGIDCQCDSGEISERDALIRCTEKTHGVCSSRGKCVCGVCHCDSRMSYGFEHTGQYCECIKDPCKPVNGVVCGGKDKGRCGCTGCECLPGFTGENCENTLATDNCVTPSSGLICNNHGTCVNNSCQCRGVLVGKTCEDCPACAGLCRSQTPCLQCVWFRSGPIKRKQCKEQCYQMREHSLLVDDISVYIKPGSRYHRCEFRDDDNCDVEFAYSTVQNDGSNQFYIQRSECKKDKYKKLKAPSS